MAFHVAERLWRNTRRNDGVVIRHFGCVEHAFRFQQGFSAEPFYQFCIDGNATLLRLVESVHDLRALGIDVVREVLRVHTGVGGQLPLVESLDGVEGQFGAHAVFSVTVHLK